MVVTPGSNGIFTITILMDGALNAAVVSKRLAHAAPKFWKIAIHKIQHHARRYIDGLDR